MAQSANMDASELARDIAAGLASATTATERAALVPAELVEAIQQLKTQRDAVILAHYYVAPEVQAVADYVGDSFYLAKLARACRSRPSCCAAWSLWARAPSCSIPPRPCCCPSRARTVPWRTWSSARRSMRRAPSTATTWPWSATSTPRSRSRAGVTCALPAQTPSRSSPSCRSSTSCSFPTRTWAAS